MPDQRPPSADQFVSACHREFRYLVTEHGFTEGPVVFANGDVDPFGVRFQGPKLAFIVQGTQWGHAVEVELDTDDRPAEWDAAVEKMRSALLDKEPAESAIAARRRLDDLRILFQLPVHWLIDQRLPDWRSRSTEKGQLAEIHGYAVALRACAGDLLRGDLSALPELFASYAEQRRQQRIRDQQEFADGMAQYIGKEAKRPRTAVEKAEIVQKVQGSIGHLRTESKILLKVLGKDPETRSVTRFMESWRSLAQRLDAEALGLAYVDVPGESNRVVERLRNAQEAVHWVQAALASGQTDRALTERVEALDHLSQELILALEGLSHSVRQ